MAEHTKIQQMTLSVFYGMYDWLDDDQRSVVEAMHDGTMTVTEAGMKVGPLNAQKWERDLTVIADAIEILQVGIMREVITEANNSLYGSQGYFITAVGGGVIDAVGVTGEPDKYHLATPIENLKARGNKLWNENEKLKTVLVEAQGAISANHGAVQAFLDMVNVMRVGAVPIPAILDTAQHNCARILENNAAILVKLEEAVTGTRR
jgi:hypothetical protein